MRSASLRKVSGTFELRGGANGCGDARYHRIGDARLAQRLDFFAATAEHEGIAALQPHRALGLIWRLRPAVG